MDFDGGSSPAFNPIYFHGSDVILRTALTYNPTLGSAAVADMVNEEGKPTFITNQGLFWARGLGQPYNPNDQVEQPMEMGPVDDQVSDMTASVSQATEVTDARNQSCTSSAPVCPDQPSSSTAMPASSASATSVPTGTPGMSITPVSGVKGTQVSQYVGYLPPHLGSAAHQLSVSAAHAECIQIIMEKVDKLMLPTKCLAEKYRDLVTGYTDGMQVIHAQTLLDLNTCSLDVCTAIGEWRLSIKGALS